MSETRSARVAVCVATYKRPHQLNQLLGTVSQLRFDSGRTVDLCVIVVDNDPSASAHGIVQALESHFPFPIRYQVERERGISFARNRAVSLASDCEYVAFVDDDEVVDPHWLNSLLACGEAFEADVVAGPVLSAFEHTPPSWVIAGCFFDTARHATGTRLPFTHAGNVLVRMDVLQTVAGPFDPRFALTGGEDTLLFMQLVSAGARLVWCDTALVTELVPPLRTTVRWILRRAYRGGNSIALCEAVVDPRWARRGSRLAKGFIRAAQGAVGIGSGLHAGKAGLIRALARVALGLGMIAGVVGRRFEEYR